MTERHRRAGAGGAAREKKGSRQSVNTRVSVMFADVLFAFVWRDGRRQFSVRASQPLDSRKENRQPTRGHDAFVFLLLFQSLFVCLLFICTHARLPPPTVTKVDSRVRVAAAAATGATEQLLSVKTRCEWMKVVIKVNTNWNHVGGP